MHNKRNDTMRESKNLKSLTQEVPMHLVISFLKIKLEDQITFLPFGFLYVMDVLLEDDGIISGTPTRYETTLERVNHVIQKGI